MEIGIKKLKETAITPTYATSGSSGFDLYATENVVILPGQTKLISTGLAFDIPTGFEVQIRPRSGLSLRSKLRVANSPGTIDSDFTGELQIIVDNIHDAEPNGFCLENQVINIIKGDRVAQGVIQKVEKAVFVETTFIEDTVRSDGGFGSTGINNKEINENQKNKT